MKSPFTDAEFYHCNFEKVDNNGYIVIIGETKKVGGIKVKIRIQSEKFLKKLIKHSNPPIK